ncbi:MAG: hypothetical protein ACI8WY_003336, partial [Planctomycetota bacterium]
YGPLYWESILRVNDVIPKDMADFVRLVEESEETVTFVTSSQGRLVFNVKEARQAQERILGRYRIPRDRSPDLSQA